MENICCNCGKSTQEILCETCNAWGVTTSEVFPTVSDVLSEQYHRIGKDGRRYWGKRGAGIVFSDGHSVLLLKRKGDDYRDHWCIPGGKAKENENPIDTAQREAKEECGSNEGQRVEQFHNQDGSHHFHTYLYSVNKPFDVTLSDEHSDSKWVPLDEVESLKLHPKFKEAWPGYLRAIKKKISRKSFNEWYAKRNSQG